MKRMITMAAGMTAVLGVGTGEASSWTSGNVCSTAMSTSPSSVSNEPFGATNTTTSPIVVNCSLADAGGGVTKITLLAYDRSTTSNLSCTVKGLDAAGNLVVDQPLSTVDGGPGTGQQIVSVAFSSTNARIWTARCTLPAVVTLAGTAWYSHMVAIALL